MPVALNWVGCLIGAVVALLIAIFVPPYVPQPGAIIIAVIGYVVAAILFVMALLALLRGRGV